VFAFVQSFSVEVLFGWPAFALFAFWEEALPVSLVLYPYPYPYPYPYTYKPRPKPKPKPKPKPRPKPKPKPRPTRIPNQVTDLIPSCTIAWILVVTGGRPAL
jgi:hypothetical protein